MLITGEANGTLHFWEGSTGEELRQLPGIFSGHFLQLSWDGTILASATNNAVHLLDVKTGKELRHFRGAWPAFGLRPNGQTLAMAMQKSWEKIRLWNTATGEELGVLAEEDSSPGYAGVADYVFSPDGRLLARVGKADLEIWEVQTGKLRRRLHGHQAGIRPVAFSPNGKTLLTGSNDTTVLIWDVARQQERRPARLSATQLQDSVCDWGGLTPRMRMWRSAPWLRASRAELAVPQGASAASANRGTGAFDPADRRSRQRPVRCPRASGTRAGANGPASRDIPASVR